MARGGARPGAGRPKSARATQEPAKKESRKVAVKVDGIPSDISAAAHGESLSPLEYMLRVMNSWDAEDARRDRMAVAAAPFVHARADDAKGGKKEQKAEAAKEVAGRFSRSAPPKLATAGGRKV